LGIQETIGKKIIVSKIAYLYFDANKFIGAGHAVRCFALAMALAKTGWNCFFVISKEAIKFINELSQFDRVDPIDFYRLQPQCDLLVIDSYHLDYYAEKYLGEKAKKVLVIDDLANRPHKCEILVDQTFSRDSEVYQHLVPKNCNIFTGNKYIMLRDGFINLRQQAVVQRSKVGTVKTLLISLGGGKQDVSFIEILMDAVKKLQFAGNVDIVLGFWPDEQKYEFLINKKVKCHVNANMPLLTLNSDVAIGASGSSMWERCCLGLPTVMISLSEDQRTIAHNLENFGAALYAGDRENFNVDKFISLLDLLIYDTNKRMQIQQKAFEVCDGAGVNRIVGAINASY